MKLGVLLFVLMSFQTAFAMTAKIECVTNNGVKKFTMEFSEENLKHSTHGGFVLSGNRIVFEPTSKDVGCDIQNYQAKKNNEVEKIKCNSGVIQQLDELKTIILQTALQQTVPARHVERFGKDSMANGKDCYDPNWDY